MSKPVPNIDEHMRKLHRYLLIGVGDAVDEACEGNNLAMDSRAIISELRTRLEAAQRAMTEAKERALSILHCGNKEKRCETCAGMATYIVKLLAATPAGKTP